MQGPARTRNSSSSTTSSSSSNSTSGPNRLYIRLNWLLRGNPQIEDAYWDSSEVCTTLARLDLCGHVMSASNLATMLYLASHRGCLHGLYMPVLGCCLILASLCQLFMMQLRPGVYRAWRYQLACFNRLSRLLMLLGPIIYNNWGVLRCLMPLRHLQQRELVLMHSVALIPLMLTYGNLVYVVPVATLLVVQLPATALSLALSAATQHDGSLMQIPGMQELADKACAHARGCYELLLHVLVDQGTLPGVPGAGFDAFGTPSRCSGKGSIMMLMLYANFSLVFFLPTYASYCVELRHKRLFWEARGVAVTVQASPLLPLPDYHLVSHCCVVLVAQILLWFLAELVTAVLVL